MVNLGVILHRRGEDGAAEAWYRRAADKEDVAAMSNLAVLLRSRGEIAEADEWTRRARDAEGDSGAA